EALESDWVELDFDWLRSKYSAAVRPDLNKTTPCLKSIPRSCMSYRLDSQQDPSSVDVLTEQGTGLSSCCSSGAITTRNMALSPNPTISSGRGADNAKESLEGLSASRWVRASPQNQDRNRRGLKSRGGGERRQRAVPHRFGLAPQRLDILSWF
ncbi:hypothetical protein BGX28_008204, partial [Mortierella sp. GBA30]